MTASRMAPKDLMEFSKALKHLDQMQVTEYLYKISDYLKKDNRELFFPNISVVDEAFLVNLVNDTRNLSNNSMYNDPENRELILEIIETLEMNRDVYRWTYTYENGKTNKNQKVGREILVYQKIFTNKINKKPAEFKKPSGISQRLVQAQSNQPSIQVQIQNSPLQSFSKIQLLNMTLRFIKNDDEHALFYPEMPLSDAQYIYSLIVNPKKNLSVGFGYKSMAAPLFEAMEAYGDDYIFKIVFVETGKCETAGLKLEKIRRTVTNNSSRDDTSVASTSSESSTRLDGVSECFVAKTLKTLVKFTSNPNKKSVVFENLSDAEMEFIRGVKELAAKKSFGVFDALFHESLVQLNKNIAEAGKKYKIRIEEKTHKRSKARWIKLKKLLLASEPESPPLSAAASDRLLASVTRGRSAVSATSLRDRSLSRNKQISFKSGGKLLLPKDNLKLPQPDETAQSAEKETIEPRQRCLSNERLDKRKTKLLEDMSTPIESDKGRRMMMLMGWNGGALGARGDGILEPLVPTIELPVGAGLGHVPPPKPVKAPKAPKATKSSKAICIKNALEFRVSFLHNILDLLLHQEDTKNVEYKTELTKRERRWVSATLRALNGRRALDCDWEEEADLEEPIQVEMHRDLGLQLVVDVSPDTKKLTLTKSTGNPPNATQEPKNPKNKYKPKIRKPKLDDLVLAALKPPKETKPVNEVVVMTNLNTSKEYELITEDSIDRIVTRVIPMINSSCKTPMAIRARAVKILILMRFTTFVKSVNWVEREFRFEKALPKKIITFIEDIILSANNRVKSGFVTSEELPWFQELQSGAELLLLTVTFDSDTKFTLKKKDRPSLPQYRKRFTNSAMLSLESKNNLGDGDLNLAPNDWASEHNENYKDVEGVDNNNKDIEDPEKIRIENEIEKVLTEVEPEIESSDKPQYGRMFTNAATLSVENNNNLSTDDQNLVQSDWARELKEFYDSFEGDDNSNKEIEDQEEIRLENETEKELTDVIDKIESICDLECKDDDVDDDTGTETAKKLETDTSSEDSLCVCDNEIDISQLDKDIQDLELAMYEADINIDTKDDEDKASSKRSRNSSENSDVADAKRTKVSEIDNILIITTNNHEDIDLNMVKEIQTRILKAIDSSDNFLPLLKCFGVQNGGLVYSCYDDNDIAWLEDIVGDLDLKINKYDDDFCWARKSRKMVMKINSFIPLDRKKVFRSIDRYNEGLHTAKWKVLMTETSSDSVLFIIEVDEKSLKYIAKENYGLYFGIDKAQFSIIHT